MGTGSSASTTKTQNLTWKEPEGCLAELLSPSKIKIGSDSDCTYAFTIVTNEHVSNSVTSDGIFKWKILMHSFENTNSITPNQICHVGFIDAHPDKAHVGAHGNLCDEGPDGTLDHKFAASFPTTGDSAALFPGDVLTFTVNFKSKTARLVQNGKQPANNITSQWRFYGNLIFPAISKDNGIIKCSIHSINDDISDLVKKFSTLAITDKTNKELAKINKKFDDEEMEGFGNKFSDDHDVDDKITLLVHGKYEIEAPDSITWIIKQESNKYRIDWGLRGSFCGVGVGRRRYTKPETGDIKVLFHFGFIFNGNDYILTDLDWNSSNGDKHWMVLDLTNTNEIGIQLCGSKTAACHLLHQVWRKNGELESKDYKYYRLKPGFCRTSVASIAAVVNKEKYREYKLCYEKSVNWQSMKDLSAYTNCMLFVIRMCKLCRMEIPDWRDIIQLFDVWEGSDRFAPHWAHFKKYATI